MARKLWCAMPRHGYMRGSRFGRLWLAVMLVLASIIYADRTDAQAVVTLRGTLTVRWLDPQRPSKGGESLDLVLFDAAGIATHLTVPSDAAMQRGALLRLDRQRVVVTGEEVTSNAAGRGRTVMVRSVRADGAVPPNGADVPPQRGDKPWLFLLCVFPDGKDQMAPPSYFQGALVSERPGLDHYWREVSYNTINIVGSGVAGPFTLPHSRAHYAELDNGLDAYAQDCATAADPGLSFAPYYGVSFAVNDLLPMDLNVAVGGTTRLRLDGAQRTIGVTWLPTWGWLNLAVTSHEMGHAFGLYHSGSPGQEYDNPWDVMSDTWTNCYRDPDDGQDPVYGCLGQHTIAINKATLGWLPPERIFVAPSGSATSIRLEQLALPQTADYLMARIPIGGSATQFYTVEARRRVGYDSVLPGDAVIVHRIDTDKNTRTLVASPDGSSWTPGMSFVDPAAGVTMCVQSATSSGFAVGIGLGATPVCPAAAPDFSSSMITLTPSIFDTEVEVSVHLVNHGSTVRNVVVTAPIDPQATYEPRTAFTSQGTVAGTGPLTFTLGTIPYSGDVELSFRATLNTTSNDPVVIHQQFALQWDGGNTALNDYVILNGKQLYLPQIMH